MNAPKPPFLDYNDQEVIDNPEFHGIVWIPSVCLRFVEREETILVKEPFYKEVMVKILQQRWETHIMIRMPTNFPIHNPNLEQWRDVPLEDE